MKFVVQKKKKISINNINDNRTIINIQQELIIMDIKLHYFNWIQI